MRDSVGMGLDESAFVADMSDFRVRRRHDIAFNTINSFRHLGSEATALRHMRCMGQAVRNRWALFVGRAPDANESATKRNGILVGPTWPPCHQHPHVDCCSGYKASCRAFRD